MPPFWWYNRKEKKKKVYYKSTTIVLIVVLSTQLSLDFNFTSCNILELELSTVVILSLGIYTYKNSLNIIWSCIRSKIVFKLNKDYI